MKELTKLICSDMRPALGVTEPGAIAFAVAKAKEHVSGELEEVRLVLNSGMYKNAFTCGIPNSHEVGNEHAAALGFVAANAKKGLECLDGVTAADNRKARELVKAGRINVDLGDISSRIHIHVLHKLGVALAKAEDGAVVAAQKAAQQIRDVRPGIGTGRTADVAEQGT